MKTIIIDNTEDIIDSRDIIERITELEDDLEFDPTDEERDEIFAELKTLRALADECSDCSVDWEHGEALIRDTYFKEYAMELAEDIGGVSDTMSWPCTCIDWDRAVEQLQMDYTSVDFDGVEYWIR